jgi:hypothetical protein
MVELKYCKICDAASRCLVRGLCRSCYNETRVRACLSCKKRKLVHGRGLCSNCYHKLGVNTIIVLCAGCKKKKPHFAKGMCKSCYNKKLTYKWRADNPEKFRKKTSDYQRRKRQKLRSKHV